MEFRLVNLWTRWTSDFTRHISAISRLSSYCRKNVLFLNLNTSVTWFGYFLSLQYFCCKRSADKSNIQWREITHFTKVINSSDILLKMYPMMINLTWYDCDISSRGSIIFHKKEPEKGGGWKVKWVVLG